MACYAFFAALVSLALYPTVIEQPATVITNLLADRELVTDGAVLTTTEAILGIFVSVFLLSNSLSVWSSWSRSPCAWR